MSKWLYGGVGRRGAALKCGQCLSQDGMPPPCPARLTRLMMHTASAVLGAG